MAAQQAAELLCSLADGDVDSVRRLIGSCSVMRTAPLVPVNSLAISATFSRSTPPDLTPDELYLLTISEDAILGILLQIKAHRDLLALRQTCHALQRLVDAEIVWESLLWTNYKKCPGGSIVAGSSREFYIEHALFVGALRERAGKQAKNTSAPASSCPTVRFAGSLSVQELFQSLALED